ncbi:hypothetical protein CWC30_18135, partial [Pseudoalteromonas sp. S4741]
ARSQVRGVNAQSFHFTYYDYSAIDRSPLFEHDYSLTGFIGFEHTFKYEVFYVGCACRFIF